MKKKVFFIIPSLASGGAERVFWVLLNYFDKSKYEICLVLLDTKSTFFSLEIENVRVIDLETMRASRSFFKLYSLIKKEKPYAVYTTSGQLNILTAIVSIFVKIPKLIGRITNIPDEMSKFNVRKVRFAKTLSRVGYKQFDLIVSQSDEMKAAILRSMNIPENKIRIIPNPIIPVENLNTSSGSKNKKLIIVARLSKVKGHSRLLQVIKELPPEYSLTIAGTGPLEGEIKEQIKSDGLEGRVYLLGAVSNIPELVSKHDVLVLSSFTEGFPNVLVEALSVGTPVVTFKVGGTTATIKEGFNGIVVNQGDLQGFKKSIVEACNKAWDHLAIKEDAVTRFGARNIVNSYAKLIED